MNNPSLTMQIREREKREIEQRYYGLVHAGQLVKSEIKRWTDVRK